MRTFEEQPLNSVVAGRSEEHLQEPPRASKRKRSPYTAMHAAGRLNVKRVAISTAISSFSMESVIEGNPPNFEADNIRFVKEETSIPIPAIMDEWEDENNRYFLTTTRVHGESLDIAWPTLSTACKERVTKQTAECISQLRKLQSPTMQSLNGQPIYSAFLFPDGYGLPHGPFSSDDELWTEMAKSLNNVPEKAYQYLRERVPSASPLTFTHGDLTKINIIVKDGNLAGILDW